MEASEISPLTTAVVTSGCSQRINYMVGTAVTQPPVPGEPSTVAHPGTLRLSEAITLKQQLIMNSYRISAMINRLDFFAQRARECDPAEFVSNCGSLARGIDFAIANNDVPGKSHELPALIKLVCQDRDDPLRLAAIMVLMISVKSACRSGWFSVKDAEELNNLAKEIASNFGSMLDFSTVPSGSDSVISTIMSRFYPNLTLGQIFVLLEVKPGFEAYLADFQIEKNIKLSPKEKFRFFVAQTDNIETSSCLVSPAKVNFLVNGVGVERRISSFMDKGPQMPTLINVRRGSNLLQAVGDFTGNYIIAVASMSEVPSADSSALQDYELQATAAVDPDSEIIEGQSRISLNCPISHQRIRTPVKGYLCRHIQCFDFDNYVEINSRRPSWRCPSCNQSVCFPDIRIDRQMVKVLQEVGDNVSNVIISADGSWHAAMESDSTIEKPASNKASTGTEESPKPDDIMDLTLIDDAMDVTVTLGTGGGKDVNQFQFVSQNTTNPHIANSGDVNQSSSPVPDDFWSGITFPMNDEPNGQVAGDSIPTSASIDLSSFLTVEVDAFNGDTFTMLPNETCLPNTLPLQQPKFENPSLSNGSGRFITQTPNAAQSLPTATPNPALQQSNRNFSPNNVSAALQASSSPPNPPSSLPMQTPSHNVQQGLRNSANTFSTSLQALHAAPGAPSTFRTQSSTPVPQRTSRNDLSSVISNSFPATSQASAAAPRMIPSAYRANPHQPSLYQDHRAQQNPFPLSQPHNRNTGFRSPNLVQNGIRVPSEHHNSSQQAANLQAPHRSSSQQAANLQAPRFMSQQSPVQFQSSAQSPRNVPPLGNAAGNRNIHERGQPISQADLIAAANRTAHMATETLRSPPSFLTKYPNISHIPSPADQIPNIGVASQPVRTTEASHNPSDTNWRPEVRMRGALTGQAYDEALSRQQAQSARTIPNIISPQLQALISGGVSQGATSPPSNHPSG